MSRVRGALSGAYEILSARIYACQNSLEAYHGSVQFYRELRQEGGGMDLADREAGIVSESDARNKKEDRSLLSSIMSVPQGVSILSILELGKESQLKQMFRF